MITLTAATLPMGLIAALVFMVLMSVITFAMYGIDKKKHWYFWAVNIVGVLLHITVIAILYKYL